jgi:hypothetical protein
MQQAMVSACSTGSQIMSFQQKRLEATHGTVPGSARARNAASYNNDIVFLRHFYRFMFSTFKGTDYFHF